MEVGFHRALSILLQLLYECMDEGSILLEVSVGGGFVDEVKGMLNDSSFRSAGDVLYYFIGQIILAIKKWWL